MRRFLRALRIYLATAYTWTTAWHVAGDLPVRVDAPVRTAKHEDGFEYVEIQPRPE